MTDQAQKEKQVERMVRFPAPLYLQIKERADLEHRSIQGQIIAELERSMKLFAKGGP